MKESLIVCPRCGSNACHVASNEKLTVWSCFGCGYTSNSTVTDKNISEIEETLPELYKALKFKDENGCYWYPIALVLENKSMIFADGTSTQNWNWSAIQSKDGKVDMTTKKEFAERDFMEALDYIGYFNQK
jgi:ribosomal protein L37E